MNARKKCLFALFLAFLTLVPLLSLAEDGDNGLLYITAPKQKEAETAYLQDENGNTRLTLSKQESLTVAWSSTNASCILLQWYEPAANISISLFDSTGTLLSRTQYVSTPYRQCVDIAGASSMTVTAGNTSCGLSEIKLYRSDEDVPYREEQTQADVLVIVSKPTECFTALGGLIPYCIDQNIGISLCVVGEEYGYIVNEAFSALENLGYPYSPLFLRKEDHHAISEYQVEMHWGKNSTLSAIKNAIQSLAPRIVVTVNPEDENAEPCSTYTSKLVSKLVVSGAFPSIEKFYTVSPSGTTVMSWDTPLKHYDGKSASEVTDYAYSLFESQQLYRRALPHKTAFSLDYSTVGPDCICDNLLENIADLTSVSYRKTESVSSTPHIQTEGQAHVPSVVDADVTPSPSSSGIEAAAPVSKETDSPFLQSDGESESYISDFDKGYWEYRSEDLAVYIERREFTLDGKPQCVYVAHIYVKNTDSFRSGLACHSLNAGTTLPPWQLARSYKAVLAITGDNLTNAEKEMKGILIRNGVFYSDCQKADTLVIKSSTEMEIIEKGTVSGLALLDGGVQNTYSFGPSLVKDGVKCDDLEKSRVYAGNPRTGIGMVDEGHFVAIVADGRDPGRAYNLTLDQFADLFLQEGACLAYNLDGGASSAMVFMGECVNWHSGRDGIQRTWVDALMWGYSDAVPGVDDTVTHTGCGDTY